MIERPRGKKGHDSDSSSDISNFASRVSQPSPSRSQQIGCPLREEACANNKRLSPEYNKIVKQQQSSILPST